MSGPGWKGIIFDFGGVFSRTGPRTHVLRQCERELGLSRDTLLNLLFSGEHWRDVSTGRTSADAYWRHVQGALGGSVPAALEPFRENPFAYEVLNGRMVSLARRLRGRCKIGLLSNATPYLDVLLTEQGLADLFDVVVNSARVGMRKPDPEVYRLTLRLLTLEPAQCLFVDDKERNTQVAQELGMTAIRFRSAAQLARQLTSLECWTRAEQA